MQLTVFQFCSLKRHSLVPLGESYEYFWQIDEKNFMEKLYQSCAGK